MAKELKEKTRVAILFTVCILLYLVLQVATVTSGILGIQNFNGVFMACQFGLCLTMIQCSNKKGIVVSAILVSITLIMLLRAFIFIDHVTPVPGIFNSTIYIITLTFMYRLFKKREHEAVTDFTTGLLDNRGLNHLLRVKSECNHTYSIIYVDLENFRVLNDRHGHTYGNLLLVEIAKRMKDVVGKRGTVARRGGDEFVIVLEGKYDAEAVSDEVLAKISEKTTIKLNGVKIECYIAAHAGIASFPKDSDDYEDIIKYSDIAMLKAFKNKSAKAYVFNKEMEREISRQLELEKLIKDALENDYFYLVYQPQYKINEKKLRGFETLIRMKTPDGTFVSPGEFIPIAEMNDMIKKIDDYVLRRSMKEFRDIVKNVNSEFVISVNVSARNISNPKFVEKIQKLLAENDFPAKNLEIEITEYCLVDSVEVTISNIKKLRKLGIHVALDDFGTGYTSLSYLAKLPISLLKIDKSLIDDIVNDERSRNFVHTVISLGHMMECDVISEGVEDSNQVNVLNEQGCNFIQGYVWGRPLEYSDAVNLSYENRQ